VAPGFSSITRTATTPAPIPTTSDAAAASSQRRGPAAPEPLGLKPGPHFGRILDALLDWVLDDPARNRGDLLEERALELAAEESGRG
jgi:hypothetical protein